MKIFVSGLSLTLLGFALTFLPASPTAAQGPPSEITAVHDPDPATYGKASTVVVTIADAGGAGTDSGAEVKATGTVTVRADSREIGTEEMVDGEAVVVLPRGLNAGSYEATVAYNGDDTHAANSVELIFTVAPRETRTTIRAPRKVVIGNRARAKVEVTTRGLVPDGVVKVKNGRDTVGRGILKGGVARIKFKKFQERGKFFLSAKYQGSGNYLDSFRDFTLKVVRKN